MFYITLHSAVTGKFIQLYEIVAHNYSIVEEVERMCSLLDMDKESINLMCNRVDDFIMKKNMFIQKLSRAENEIYVFTNKELKLFNIGRVHLVKESVTYSNEFINNILQKQGIVYIDVDFPVEIEKQLELDNIKYTVIDFKNCELLRSRESLYKVHCN